MDFCQNFFYGNMGILGMIHVMFSASHEKPLDGAGSWQQLSGGSWNGNGWFVEKKRFNNITPHKFDIGTKNGHN